MGIAGRTTYGHVDDYYLSYLSTAEDPYISGGWTEHSKDCIADYLGTNQYKYTYTLSDGTIKHIVDGATLWSYYMDGSEYTGGSNPLTLEYGLRKYIESKNYVVSECYTKVIEDYMDNSGNIATNGFTFDDFKNEIDNDHPVIIQLEGHTILGFGYSTANGANKIYVKDTWDTRDHEMYFGGTYSDGSNNLQMIAVTIVHISSPPDGPPTCINCSYPGFPSAPTLSSAVYNSVNNYVKLTWSSSPDADYYVIYRCPSNRAMTDNDIIGHSEGLTYNDCDFIASSNTSYKYVVAGVNNTGEGNNSNEISVALSPCLVTNVNNITFVSDTEIKCNAINVGDVIIQNNSNVIFDAVGNIKFTGAFQAKLGSTLQVK
jgi:hypothetical protein